MYQQQDRDQWVQHQWAGPGPAKRPGYQQYDVEAGLGVGQFDIEKQLRLGFVRKVYSIFAFQMLLTVGWSACAMYVESFNFFILSNPGLVILGAILSFALLIALFCYQNRHPLNMYLLVAWTVVEAYTVGVVTASYARAGAGDVVIQAFALTAAVFIGLTLFTMQSKIDFSFLGATLFMALWMLIIWGFVNAIFGWRDSWIYSLFGALIFSLYIVFDTFLIMERLSYDDYIIGAISLYLDILNLFLFILQLLSSRREN